MTGINLKDPKFKKAVKNATFKNPYFIPFLIFFIISFFTIVVLQHGYSTGVNDLEKYTAQIYNKFFLDGINNLKSELFYKLRLTEGELKKFTFFIRDIKARDVSIDGALWDTKGKLIYSSNIKIFPMNSRPKKIPYYFRISLLSGQPYYWIEMDLKKGHASIAIPIDASFLRKLTEGIQSDAALYQNGELLVATTPLFPETLKKIPEKIKDHRVVSSKIDNDFTWVLLAPPLARGMNATAVIISAAFLIVGFLIAIAWAFQLAYIKIDMDEEEVNLIKMFSELLEKVHESTTGYEQFLMLFKHLKTKFKMDFIGYFNAQFKIVVKEPLEFDEQYIFEKLAGFDYSITEIKEIKSDDYYITVVPVPVHSTLKYGWIIAAKKRILLKNDKARWALVHLSEILALYESGKSQAKKLAKMAFLDPLTQIFNRRFFMIRATADFNNSISRGEPCSVIMVDIDHFKKFNDTYGHQYGDEVLKTVAGILSSSLRDSDILGRYGGEEFVVFLPGTTIKEAERIAERLRQAVEKYPMAKENITISLGVTQCMAGESLESAIERADKALYRAKENGRNRVEVVGNERRP